MKVLTLLACLIFSQSIWARSYVIFSLAQDLSMGTENEIIRKNYYVNMGSGQGVKKDSLLDVFRIVSVQNPYDNKKAQAFIYNIDKPEDEAKSGDIILWDAHFSPNEGGIPLSKLKDNSNFKLIKEFKPDQSYTVLGGYEYAIYIFQRN